MEKTKVGIRAKFYFIIGLIFLLQLISNINFVATNTAREMFVILPGICVQ